MDHLDKLGDKMEKKIEKMFGVGKNEVEVVDPVECMLPQDVRLADQTLVALCIRLKNVEWAKKQTHSLEHDLNMLWKQVRGHADRIRRFFGLLRGESHANIYKRCIARDSVDA